jgi:hypothetical protein
MRPVPVRQSDEMLAPFCRAMGIEQSPRELSPAVRAAVNAQLNAQMNPNPRARRYSTPRVVPVQQGAFGFDDQCVDIKRRAANDFDEE